MKQINNRQKLVVRPRESIEKYLIKEKGVQRQARLPKGGASPRGRGEKRK